MGSLRENLEISIGAIIRKVIHPQSGAYKNLQFLYRHLLSIKRQSKNLY